MLKHLENRWPKALQNVGNLAYPKYQAILFSVVIGVNRALKFQQIISNKR